MEYSLTNLEQNPLSKTHVLLVDDDAGHRDMLRRMLNSWDYLVLEAQSGRQALHLAYEANPDPHIPVQVVLMDIRMADMDGITALKEFKQRSPDLPIIMMTAYSSVDTAIEALRLGAYDYLNKPLDFDELKLTLERACEHAKLKIENQSLKVALKNASALNSSELIGNSPAMLELKKMIATIAPTDATVLIEGESGSGKELVARAIHMASLRNKKDLVLLNCAALSENLLESELFGHEKGSFTGADKKREGRFIQADKASLFLDEIGELPLTLQPKLLRALQQGEIQRVGSDKLLQVDARVIAATNRALLQEVAEGRFREDLYFRLNVISVKVPALRERASDIPLLSMHFLNKFSLKNHKEASQFSTEVLELLSSYTWSGNIRELQNTIERAVILSSGECIEAAALPDNVRNQNKVATKVLTNSEASGQIVAAKSSEELKLENTNLAGLSLFELERRAINDTLTLTEGNRSESARMLGITRSTLLKKIKIYKQSTQKE